MEPRACSFVEIYSDDNDNDETSSPSSSLCDAYVAVIEPKQCSSLVKRLTRELPLPSECRRNSSTTVDGDGMVLDFSHLKRVKRFIINSSSSSSNSSMTINMQPPQSATAVATGDEAVAAGAGHDDSNKRQKTDDDDDVDSSSSTRDYGSAVTTATPMIMTTDTSTRDAIPSSSSSEKKKMKNQFGVLLGPVSTLDRLYGGGGGEGGGGGVPLDDDDTVNNKAAEKEEANTTTTTTTTTTIATLKALYNLTENENEIIIVQIPRRLAESKQEHKLFNDTYWPCLYFPKKTRQYKLEQRQLSDTDVEQMKMGMTLALQDALQQQQQYQQMSTVVGTVVVSPADGGQVVARASEERALQQHKAAGCTTTTTIMTSNSNSNSHSNNNYMFQNNNPLQTSVMLALQSVARLERGQSSATTTKGTAAGMTQCTSDDDFCTTTTGQQHQYLCTGYDVYTTLEPSVMDAMAMVHARVRRVIFGAAACCSSSSDFDDYANCGLTVVKVHELPGTNHKYRAFTCQTGSKLWKECRQLLQQPQKQQQHPNEHKGHNDEL